MKQYSLSTTTVDPTHQFNSTISDTIMALLITPPKEFHKLQFANSSQERGTHIAMNVRLLKELVAALSDTYQENCDAIMNTKNGRGVKITMKRYNKSISAALAHIESSLDSISLLTRRKTAVAFTAQMLLQNKKKEAYYQNAKDRIDAPIPTNSAEVESTRSALSCLNDANTKFKAEQKKKRDAFLGNAKDRLDDESNKFGSNNKRKILTRTVKEQVTSSSEMGKIVGSIKVGESTTTFTIMNINKRQPDRTNLCYEFPNPNNTFHDRMYSQREIVQHTCQMLNKPKRLIEYLHQEGITLFRYTTYLRIMNIADMNDEDTWPTPNFMGKESGRPGELTLTEVFAINDGVKACTGRGQDAIKDVEDAVVKKRQKTCEMNGVDMSIVQMKNVSRQSVRNYANCAVIANDTVDHLPENNFRLLSAHREMTERSPRACVSEIIVAVATSFVLGKWHNSPPVNELSDGCKLAVDLARRIFGVYDVRPRDSRYLLNFDDTGGFFSNSIQPSVRKTTISRVSKKATTKKKRGRDSIHQEQKKGEGVTDGTKAKFKVYCNAEGKIGRTIIEFNIFTPDQLKTDNGFVAIKVPGLSIGGDVSIPGLLDYGIVILSWKGTKAQNNGISASQNVTEYFYKERLHEFITAIRENDPASKWTPGAPVPEGFESVTYLDSEQSMMTFLKEPATEQLDAKLGNIVAKINSGGTKPWQPCDAGTIFKDYKHEMKTTTCKGDLNEPAKFLKRAFENLVCSGVLQRAKGKDFTNIIDIVAKSPAAMAKVMTRKKVRAGFLRTGRLSVNMTNNDLIVQCMDVDRMMRSSSINFGQTVMYTCPETDTVTNYTMGKFIKEKVLPDACEQDDWHD
eukprot:scaffold4900_cov123-Chaetoceros_neogracile.AAC.1